MALSQGLITNIGDNMRQENMTQQEAMAALWRIADGNARTGDLLAYVVAHQGELLKAMDAEARLSHVPEIDTRGVSNINELLAEIYKSSPGNAYRWKDTIDNAVFKLYRDAVAEYYEGTI